MAYPKSNAWHKWLPVCILPLAVLACSVASGQGTGGGGGGGGGGGNTGGGGAGQQISGGSDLLDFQEEFIGDVERTGAVGQFTEPVGASATSAAAGLSGATGARTGSALGGLGGGLGGLGGLGAAFNNPLGTGAVGGESLPPLRTRLRSAVALPPTTAYDQIARETRVNNRLRSVSTLGPRPQGRDMTIPGAAYGSTSARPLYGVNVQMQGRTAILQGTVNSPADRRMSELLIRLEPGVSQVENRISVAP